MLPDASALQVREYCLRAIVSAITELSLVNTDHSYQQEPGIVRHRLLRRGCYPNPYQAVSQQELYS